MVAGLAVVAAYSIGVLTVVYWEGGFVVGLFAASCFYNISFGGKECGVLGVGMDEFYVGGSECGVAPPGNSSPVFRLRWRHGK